MTIKFALNIQRVTQVHLNFKSQICSQVRLFTAFLFNERERKCERSKHEARGGRGWEWGLRAVPTPHLVKSFILRLRPVLSRFYPRVLRSLQYEKIECFEQSISKSVHKINNNIKLTASWSATSLLYFAPSFYLTTPPMTGELEKFLTSLKKAS